MFLCFYCSDKSKRRTTTITNSSEPRWNQTFMYKESGLRNKTLEITVWDYDRIGASDFLGEVCTLIPLFCSITT